MPEQPTTTAAPRRRWPWFLLGGLLTAMLVLVVTYLWIERHLAELLTRLGSQAVLGRVVVAEARITWPLELELSDLAVYDSKDRTVLSVAQVRARISAHSLLQRRIEIMRLVARSLDVHLLYAAGDEAPSLVQALTARESKTSGEPWPIAVSEAEIQPARLHVVTERQEREVLGLRVDVSMLAYEEETLRLEGARVTRAGSLLDVTGTARLDARWLSGVVAANLDLADEDLSSLAPAQWTTRLAAQGRLSARTRIEGSFGALRGELDLAGDDLRVYGLPATLRAEARYDASAIELVRASLAAGASLVSAHGTFALDPDNPDPLRLVVRASAIPIASVARTELPEHVSSPVATLLEGATLSGHGVVTTRDLHDLEAELVTSTGRVVAVGDIGFSREVPWELGVRLDAVRPGRALRAYRVPLRASHGEASLVVRGPFDRPSIRGRVVPRGLSHGLLPPVDIEASLTLEDELLHIEQAVLRSAVGQATLRADVSPIRLVAFDARKLTVRGQAVLQRVRLEAISERRLQGLLHGHLDLRGALLRPELSARLDVRELVAFDAPLGQLNVEARSDGRVAVATARATGPAGTVVARADYAFETQVLVLDARTEGLDLAPITKTVAPVHALRAMATVDLQASATAGRLTSLLLTLDLRDVALGQASFPGMLRARVQPSTSSDSFSVDLDLFGEARANAELRLQPEISIEGRASFASLHVERFVPVLAESQMRVVAAGEGEFSYRRGRGVLAAARLEQVVATLQGETLRSLSPVSFVYEDGRLRVDELRLGSGAGELAARGSIGEEVELEVAGVLDTAFAAALVPAVAYAQGRLLVDATVNGPLSEPNVFGRLTLRDELIVRLRGLPNELRLNEARIDARTIDGKRVQIDADMRGDLDGGTFTLLGTMVAEGLVPVRYEASLQGQNLPFRARDLSIEANAGLRLVGEHGHATLLGRIDIARGRYSRKFELREFSFTAQKKPPSEPLERKYPWIERVELDLLASSDAAFDVKVDAGVVVMDLTLSSDVSVHGTAARPRLAGRIEASRGRITFPEAELEVTQAEIELSPAAEGAFETRIQMQAEGDVDVGTSTEASAPSYLVTLGLEGDLSELKLDLKSEPPLSRLELLTLLITGQAATRALTGAGASGLDAALVFAGSQLTAPLSRFVERQLEEVLNLRLELGAELTQGAVRVTASKEVVRRLRLEGAYSRALSGVGSTTLARARFQISDRLFLEGQAATVYGQTQDLTSQDTRDRVQLKWRLYGE